MSLKLQYVIVCIILLLAIVYAAVKFHHTIKSKNSACSGCGLKESCNKTKKEFSCPDDEKGDCCNRN